MTLIVPWLLAASSVFVPGFQHTALMNWLLSWLVLAGALPTGSVGSAEKTRLATGFDIIL